MKQRYDVAIVGAGHGGAQAAIALRQRGFSGSIAIFGEEADLPYERPPLSKHYLSGTKSYDRILIRPQAFWRDRNVEVLTGHRVVSVDADAHQLMTSQGSVVSYRQLIWSAGGHARRLSCSGGDLPGVHSVRSRADVDQLIADLPITSRVCVIGGGYIGLEAAAVLTTLGKSVTVLEAQDRVLARVTGEALSRFYETEHRARGVDVRLNARVDCITEDRGRASGVLLSDGELLRCEMVIVGIGIVPSVDPLLMAGAVGGDGVRVDAQCRASLPDVYAIGDCALHESVWAGGSAIRLESVQNANDMANTVAGAITGAAELYRSVPWFWSDQYDLKLQTIGLSTGHDAAVVRGDPLSRSFSVIYLRQGRVVALDCVNAVKDYVAGRRLVTDGLTIDPSALADTSRPLKELS